MSHYNQPGMGCPFDYRLARTPYLVLPKLAIQSMPMEWRRRFEAMLQEMDDTGMSTPSYVVLRDDGPRGRYTRGRVVNPETGFVRICGGEEDPWANYRYGSVEDINPDYKRPVTAAPEPVERRPSPTHVWIPGWDGEFGTFRDAMGKVVLGDAFQFGVKRRFIGVVEDYCPEADTFGIKYRPHCQLMWVSREGLSFDE